MRYGVIEQLWGQFPVRLMCQVLEVSRGGYYDWVRRPQSQRAREDRRLGVEIKALFAQHQRRYGSPRIHRALRDQGIRCARKRVARLMREAGLVARRRRRFRVTTQSKSGRPVAPNLLDRRFTVNAPDVAWIGDLTYLWTPEGWLYLAVLMDLCSRRIVGWAVSARIEDDLTLEALTMALQQRQPGRGLLHHSDRGSQYTSDDYLDKLKEHGFKISMSGKGDCWDSAPIESFFSRLKEELGDCFISRAAARAELFQYIEMYYDRQRLHSSLQYTTPAQFESTWRAEAAESTAAVGTDATVEIAPRFPPPLGDRSALSTSSHSTTTTTE